MDKLANRRLQLSRVSKEELIEKILEQELQIEQLQKKIQELERESYRQSAPFRVREEKKKPDKQKAGAKKGHPGYFRRVSGPIDEQLEVPLGACPHCQGQVHRVKPVKQVIEELVIRPYRISLLTYRGYCQSCGIVHSTHPAQSSTASGSAGCHLGARASATALLLNYGYGMSKRKVSELFTHSFGLPLTIGGLVSLHHRMADAFKADYEQLLAEARSSATLYSDETSWYMGKPKAWLWTFTNPQLTIYQVADSRSREVIEKVIGTDYQGVLVSDCLSVYDDLCIKQQKCYAHHLKAISQALEKMPESAYLQQWQTLLKEAIMWKKKQACLPTQAYDQGCISFAIRAVALLKEPRDALAEEKIRNRLSKQADHLFVFLTHRQVEATNNRAERSLRPAVVHRKISCGNKTRKGADTFQVLSSIVATATQNKQDFTDKVRAIIKQRL